MEYIIITNYSSRGFEVETDTNGFIEKFSSYESALEYAQQYELNNFDILTLCSHEKNHLI